MLQALEVIGQAHGNAVVGPKRLEQAGGVGKARVEDRHAGLGCGDDAAVEVHEVAHRHAPPAGVSSNVEFPPGAEPDSIPKAASMPRALASVSWYSSSASESAT